MTTVSTVRRINAPIEKVFAALSNVDEFTQAIPSILDVEFLSDQTRGVGTRFRETRDMNGCKSATILEVTEMVENDHIRMVSDQGGTIWDTLFSVREQDGEVEMTMEMDCRPYRLMARILNLFIMGMIRKAIESDMDCVKAHCEKAHAAAS